MALGAAIEYACVLIMRGIPYDQKSNTSITTQWLPVARSGTKSDLGNVIVNDPGQNASIKACAVAEISVTKGFMLFTNELCK